MNVVDRVCIQILGAKCIGRFSHLEDRAADGVVLRAECGIRQDCGESGVRVRFDSDQIHGGLRSWYVLFALRGLESNSFARKSTRIRLIFSGITPLHRSSHGDGSLASGALESSHRRETDC